MNGTLLPQPKSRTQVKRDRRAGQHGVCNCVDCSALRHSAEHPNRAWALKNPVLSKKLGWDAAKLNAPSHVAFFKRVRTVVRSKIGPAFDAMDALQRGIAVQQVPGYVILLRRDLGDGAAMSFLVPLTIAGHDFSDGGAALLREVIRDANVGDTDPSYPFDLAVWITGVFDAQTPLHVAAADAGGNACGLLLSGDVDNEVTVDFMAAALSLLQPRQEALLKNDLAFARGYRGDVAALRATPETYFTAFVLMNSAWKAMLKEVDRLKSEASSAAERVTRQIQDATATARSQADERRKEAVRALTDRLDAARARADASAMEAGALRVHVARLEQELTVARRPDGQSTSTAQLDVRPPPTEDVKPADAIDDDEASEHWRRSAEHQAEVIRQLRVSLAHSAAAAAAGGRRAGDQQLEAFIAPRRLANIEDWAAENADRVIVLSRAVHAAKKSNYSDEAYVFKVLDLLATTYRDVKLGVADRMAFKDACLNLGLDMGGSISEAPSEDYFFNWRRRRVFLDQHVGRGNSRDTRFCLRVYFTWLEVEAKVVIGWLPSHLPTRST